ncbi:radical SAM family heme chaperone HemW [endosymbiont of unidentified scaly snail isolate Monju]|uniref:radical SAM family heme chaperone HemW n=1 Tax=endosymbiont of unidentified scaly snail isolate Monju TaxID=1248727 RepID=UPI000389251A|nr:radical SAM family heme chaperone HemW [endosymbiont of unidentified scaly snail isolate Monju]BAN70208.1 oxygen-independent coproporphyrinogen III oxidase [endosymbiont of unidentified scaly snail isolate Monju]
MIPPPLGLYVHIPWCLRKCPYCDFNSHAVSGEVPEAEYVDALLADLDVQAPRVAGRAVETVFIGGGTPSLFSGAAIGRLLEGIAARLDLTDAAEITLEANPGTAEAARFADYRAAGVNRLSIGVQSLDDQRLRALGRVHDAAEARQAVGWARAAGFDNLNLDLMYGLPGQDLQAALADLDAVLALAPEHLSWYQLTLEPNTLFHARPPALPDGDTVGDIMEAGLALLAGAGFRQYEISAHARPGRAARHNRNYWTFGDYLGIGAGAHGKLSAPDGRVRRYSRPRHPRDYLAAPAASGSERILSANELPLEFLMNALRLHSGVPATLFRERTGLSLAVIETPLAQARARGLLEDDPAVLRPTALGRRFLDDLLLLFEVGE